MSTRDAVETALRAWNADELSRRAAAAVDFGFHPEAGPRRPRSTA
ncbi:hypothetical protein [Actinoallomurus acaciae]|uniref:Uncharacterized protein n=1 Tax=Actinoallomurus acaciae TaxID=502577 RepID=A0ABV5YFH8_9ACTN